MNEQEHAGDEAGDEQQACGNEEYAESRIFSEHIYRVTLSIDVIGKGFPHSTGHPALPPALRFRGSHALESGPGEPP